MTPPLVLYVGPGDTGDLVQQPDAASFLAARWVVDWNGDLPILGRSSNQMAMYGVGVEKRPTAYFFPDDASDLAACERTWLMAPDDVRTRMLPVLVEYREHVAGRGQG